MSKTVLVLTGAGNPARAAANIYAERFAEADCTVHFVENAIGPRYVLAFFRRRLKRFGLADTIGTFFLRLTAGPSEQIEKAYRPERIVHDLDELTEADIERWAPDIVITNACALLSAGLIEKFHKAGCEIINVHNGLNPRYRGTGNVWAFLERNFELTGVTLHRLDAGIDTGETICARRIDFITDGVPFEQTDIEAFRAGAEMAVDYALTGKVSASGIDVSEATRRSRAYTYPSWSQYHAARARYAAAQSDHLPTDNEASWQNSFQQLAGDDNRNIYERQHWGDAASITRRDALVRELVDQAGPGETIVDVGCGDGRYRTFWLGASYWGCDYSLETMSMGGALTAVPPPADAPAKPEAKVLADADGNHFLEAPASDLPLKDRTASTLLAVGLMQHIDNTGALADELLRVLAPGGSIVLNTLRQPTRLELLPVLLLGLVKPAYRELGRAMWRQDYFSGGMIGGTKLARRYSLDELRTLLAPQARVGEVRYGGLFGTRWFSRELTIVFRSRD